MDVRKRIIERSKEILRELERKDVRVKIIEPKPWEIISKKVHYLLLLTLVIINVALRYPLTPHEIGWDSFFIHGLAESITENGYGVWWIHPLSFFGLYPYSYASAVPTILSGISQVTGIEMEWSIWLFSTIIGVLSGLTAYMMAGEFRNNSFFKFAVGFSFSIFPGTLMFTTWTISTRGLFLVLLPLFIYFLLKMRRGERTRFGFLALLLFITLMLTHHIYTFIIIIIFAYLTTLFLYRKGAIEKFSIPFKNLSKYSKTFAFFLFFILLFLLPLIAFRDEWLYYYAGSLLKGLPKIELISRLIIFYGARVGILVFIGFFGFLVLLHQKRKGLKDILLIILLLLYTPLLFVESYLSLFILFLAAILVGFGIMKLMYSLRKNRAKAFVSVILILMTASCYSLTIQVWHPGLLRIQEPTVERYMEDESYNTALWCKGLDGESMLSNDGVVSARLSAISGRAFLSQYGAYELINNFVNEDEIRTKVNPVYKWSDEPLTTENAYETRYMYWYQLINHDSGSKFSVTMRDKFNCTYAVENEKIKGKQTYSFMGIKDSKFFSSLHRERYKVYDNGKESIYYLY